MANFVFRRIAGRIVRIKVTPGFKPDQTVLRASAGIRARIKQKIAAATSLAEKRIQAVNSVARYIKSKTNEFRKRLSSTWHKLGGGASLYTFEDPLRKGWAVKSLPTNSLGGDQIEVILRGRMKAILSKHKLAPETFYVGTTKKDYLVQKILKPTKVERFELRGGTIGPDEMYKKGFDAVTTLKNKVKRVGIEPVDLNMRQNVGLQGGKLKTYDAGLMTLLRQYSPDEMARIKKFRISKRKVDLS